MSAVLRLPAAGTQRVLFSALLDLGLSGAGAAQCAREVDLAPGERWQLAALDAFGIDGAIARRLLDLALTHCADCGADLPSRTTCAMDHPHSRAYCCPCGIGRMEQMP